MAGERVDARGKHIRQAGAGGGGRVRVRGMSGVCVCVCVCVGGGGRAHLFLQDWSQSLPRNMRGPGEGKGRGREIPPSPVTLGTIECLEAILLKNQLSLPTAHAPKSMCQEGRGDYRDGVRLARWMYRLS